MQRQKWEVLFSIGLVSLIFASSLNFIYLTWMLDEHGLSIMSQKLPYWDFSNLWAGGRLAASAPSRIFSIYRNIGRICGRFSRPICRRRNGAIHHPCC